MTLQILFAAPNFQVLFAVLILIVRAKSQQPTLYEYFSQGGITEGLKADNRQFFTLNGKEFKIFSGSLHYFRVHPDLWRDRLKKYRAAGLNAVDV